MLGPHCVRINPQRAADREDDLLYVDRHRRSELSINSEDSAATTLKNLTDKNVATINMDVDSIHIVRGKPLDSIYCMNFDWTTARSLRHSAA